MKKVLFLCKRHARFREDETDQGRASGLTVSCSHVSKSLIKSGINSVVKTCFNVSEAAKAIELEDPDVIIFEALWLMPNDMKELIASFHYSKRFAVHLHSNIPFLACESQSFTILNGYRDLDISVDILTNSVESYQAYRVLYRNVYYLPNVYDCSNFKQYEGKGDDTLHVGCFGAIRPMKNHVTQAIAAISTARNLGLKLKFYVNSSRMEMNGQPVFQNLVQVFSGKENYRLEPTGWMSQDDFFSFLRGMDVSMQCSMTETFNIVTADAVAAGIPVVVSPAIDWVDEHCVAENNSIDEIASTILRVLRLADDGVFRNQVKLKRYSEYAEKSWQSWVKWGVI